MCKVVSLSLAGMAFCVATQAMGAIMGVSLDFSATGAAVTNGTAVGVLGLKNYQSATSGLVATPVSGSLTDLKDGNNTATTLDADWFAGPSGSYQGGYSFAGTTTDWQKFVGSVYFIRSAAAIKFLSVAQIPYAQYDVYVYGTQDKDRNVKFSLGGQDRFVRQLEASGNYVESTATTSGAATLANYVHFTNLTASSFDLYLTGLGDLNQAAVGGVQIVEVPEPGTLALLGLATSALALRRRTR